MVILATGFRSYGGARIVVEDEWLQAGQARIEVKFIGSVLALDKSATRELSGSQADARAFLLLRPYLKRAVKVQITDPADPAPYWLICTRRPEALASALTTLGERHG